MSEKDEDGKTRKSFSKQKYGQSSTICNLAEKMKNKIAIFFWSIVLYANYKTCVGIIFWQEDFSRWYTSSFSNQFKSKALTYKGVNMFLYKRASLLINLVKVVTIVLAIKTGNKKRMKKVETNFFFDEKWVEPWTWLSFFKLSWRL